MRDGAMEDVESSMYPKHRVGSLFVRMIRYANGATYPSMDDITGGRKKGQFVKLAEKKRSFYVAFGDDAIVNKEGWTRCILTKFSGGG
jgi:hypothetical protein